VPLGRNFRDAVSRQCQKLICFVEQCRAFGLDLQSKCKHFVSGHINS